MVGGEHLLQVAAAEDEQAEPGPAIEHAQSLLRSAEPEWRHLRVKISETAWQGSHGALARRLHCSNRGFHPLVNVMLELLGFATENVYNLTDR